ncbi:MAG: glycosyltransferase family 9 protein [Ignavibacteria bacterium]
MTRILVNALSGIGDVLMFTPALQLLRRKLPQSQVDFLVMYKSVRQLFEVSKLVDRVYFIDFFHQSKWESLRQIKELRKNRYDVSINVYPSNRFEYNFLNYLLGAKKRIAHRYTHSNILRVEFLNTDLVDEEPDRHNVLQNVDLIKKIISVDEEEIPQMNIDIPEEKITEGKDWIAGISLSTENLIGFHPGSALLKNHINKRWDKKKFAELGKILMEKHNATILLFGNEFDLIDEINQALEGRAIKASTDNFLDSLVRMKYCKVFVSNDTAFLHSAAALQIPVVAIFGYTNHKELYPWKTEHIIVRKDYECSPCFYNSPKAASCKWSGEERFKCIKDITVAEVYGAVLQLLKV